MDPGVIKAFHLHRRQTDVWFVPPGDRMLRVRGVVARVLGWGGVATADVAAERASAQVDGRMAWHGPSGRETL